MMILLICNEDFTKNRSKALNRIKTLQKYPNPKVSVWKTLALM